MKFAIFFAFYKNIYWLTFSVTMVCVVLCAQSNETLVIIPLLWTKVITNSLALLYFHIFQRERLYFYFNLGYSARQLYAAIFFADFIICAILIWLIFLLK